MMFMKVQVNMQQTAVLETDGGCMLKVALQARYQRTERDTQKRRHGEL